MPNTVVNRTSAVSPEPSTISRQPSAMSPPLLSWSVWTVAATFYLAAFYLRTSPAVMTTELMRDFGIGASQLGQFSAFYFYAYIAMQIPTGVLVDSWGARRLLIGGSLAAAAGTSLFGVTSSYALASLRRAGVGGAAAAGGGGTPKVPTPPVPPRPVAVLFGLGGVVGDS